MSVATAEPILEVAGPDPGAGSGGMPARRAVVRWAWQMFRREWKQQVLVLALLVLAVAASVGIATAAFNVAPVGMEPAAGEELLQFLYSRVAFPEYQCRLRWQPGDVAFWDNRSTQHYASSDYFPARRVMERITVVGDRPR